MQPRMGDRPDNRDHGFRSWAALMLWVWMVSRSVCVAHCHGLTLGGRASVPETSAVSHGCCSKTRAESRTEARSGLLGNACRAASDSDSSAASDSGHPAVPTNSCQTQAVVRPVEPLDSLPIIGIPRSFAGSDPLDGSHRGVLDPGLRSGAHRPTFCGAFEPRWDRGFEPVQTLGAGLRSLAPPVIG